MWSIGVELHLMMLAKNRHSLISTLNELHSVDGEYRALKGSASSLLNAPHRPSGSKSSSLRSESADERGYRGAFVDWMLKKDTHTRCWITTSSGALSGTDGGFKSPQQTSSRRRWVSPVGSTDPSTLPVYRYRLAGCNAARRRFCSPGAPSFGSYRL